MVSKIDKKTGTRTLKQAVEVNLKMNKDLKLEEAKIYAQKVRDAILKIPDVHEADIHIELFDD